MTDAYVRTPEISRQRKRRAAELLARGHPRADVCRMLVPPLDGRTLRRWLTEPAFRQAAQPTEDTVFEPDAITTLRALLNSDLETVRLSAARALLLSSAGEADQDDDE